MRIVKLEAENFKRLQAVEITPEGHIVSIEGNNDQGKSSVLDAIWVALEGLTVAPPEPVRKGEQKATIRLDMGEMIVTRTFTVQDGNKYTSTLKVTNSEGLRYDSPQQQLNQLIGEIGFDPFEFVSMKPDEQADTLLGMVPLEVDLDEMAEADEADRERRRDINRDAKALVPQIEAIVVPDKLPERIDPDELVDQLGRAGDHNTSVEREKDRRARIENDYAELTQDIADAEQRLEEMRARAKSASEQIASWDPVEDPIDTSELRRRIEAAEETDRLHGDAERRAELQSRFDELKSQSEALTARMEEREAERASALRAAEMPIRGLGFRFDDKGRGTLLFEDVPFEQASSAQQLRVSTAIAMAANPRLRVLRVKDGSLLDENSMKLLSDMIADQDFQLWIERVGTGGVGIIIEDGHVRGSAPKKPPVDKKAKKSPPVAQPKGQPETPDGTLV